MELRLFRQFLEIQYFIGGNISLASLIQLLELFGFNDRAVRTSVFRLVKMIGYVQIKSAEPVLSNYRFEPFDLFAGRATHL